MRDKIHPKYDKATVTCACGNTFETGSTNPKLDIEVCSACHPFYTGKQKFVDTAGRVDRFKEMQEKAAQMKKKAKGKKKAKPAKEKKVEPKKKVTPKKKVEVKSKTKSKTAPETKKKKS